jgi:hypothetical protein
LKLRAGLVRCGACKEIFNGVEHLLGPDEMQQVPARPVPTPPRPAGGAAPAQANAITSSAQASSGTASPTPPVDAASTDDTEPDHAAPATAHESGLSSEAHETESAPAENMHLSSPRSASDDEAITDPLQRMTLMDFTAFDTRHSEEESTTDEKANAHDELSQAIDDLRNKPWRSEKSRKLWRGTIGGADKSKKAEPGFMARARRQKRYGKAARLTMGIGSAILFLALLMQGVFAFRDTIAAYLPEYRPVLTGLCIQLGCQVRLPAGIDKVSIESSELHSLPSSPNKFTLTALLLNQAASDQAWPYLELTLNDMNEKPVARKVFQPGDYLASQRRVMAGFPAESEQPLKVSFELLELKAAGYRLYLFYP